MLSSQLVFELRAMFRTGATPAALIARIAERHAGDPHLDATVRAYFRDAFHIPMIRIGLEQVQDIAAGGDVPGLTERYAPQIARTRHEWDDTVAAGGEAVPDPESIPELAASWGRMDDEARAFVRRLIATASRSQASAAALAVLLDRQLSPTG